MKKKACSKMCSCYRAAVISGRFVDGCLLRLCAATVFDGEVLEKHPEVKLRYRS
jgi:hypothetical protein